MVFSSAVFLVLFLPLTVIAYYNPITNHICRKNGNTLRNVILLISSLAFYSWGEPLYVFLMIISILVTYFVGIGISSSKSSMAKAVLGFGISYHIVILFVFKYSTFFVPRFIHMFNKEYSPTWSIILPIGISFYSFQLMSYMFDVYYKKAKAQKDLLSLALYATMFPQLVAGPIVRYNEISKEISGRVEDKNRFYEGTERFIYGLGKKVLLADNLAYAVDAIWLFDHRTISVAWFGAICYTLQIYFDFSGYSDMAIGLGKMFGFDFPENFNYPYISGSVTEFWRRWHISLSTWFRDYVYIPLGGNRVSGGRWIRNIFLVWLLTGVWHGANWTFIVWGLLYFVILLIEKKTDFVDKLKWTSHIYTMLVVCMAWVLFRSNSLSQGIAYICEMFDVNSLRIVIPNTLKLTLEGTVLTLIVSIVLAMPIFPKMTENIGRRYPGLDLVIRPIITLGIFILAFAKVMGQSYTAFIYFNF